MWKWCMPEFAYSVCVCVMYFRRSTHVRCVVLSCNCDLKGRMQDYASICAAHMLCTCVYCVPESHRGYNSLTSPATCILYLFIHICIYIYYVYVYADSSHVLSNFLLMVVHKYVLCSWMFTKSGEPIAGTIAWVNACKIKNAPTFMSVQAQCSACVEAKASGIRQICAPLNCSHHSVWFNTCPSPHAQTVMGMPVLCDRVTHHGCSGLPVDVLCAWLDDM